MGSSREMKSFLGKTVNDKLKKHYRGKDWEVVGFDRSSIVIRVERENIKFSRKDGRVLERFSLGDPR